MAVSVKAFFACHTAKLRKVGGFQVRTHLLLQKLLIFLYPILHMVTLAKADVQVNFCGHGVGQS